MAANNNLIFFQQYRFTNDRIVTTPRSNNLDCDKLLILKKNIVLCISRRQNRNPQGISGDIKLSDLFTADFRITHFYNTPGGVAIAVYDKSNPKFGSRIDEFVFRKSR